MCNSVATYSGLHPILFQLASLLTFTSIPTVFCGVRLSNAVDSENRPLPSVEPSNTEEEDEFYRLLARDSYVDKTLMINDFLRKGGLVCRILRPRGWGKTVNLRMLKRFLELEVDAFSGEPLAKANRTNARLFDGSGTVIRLPRTNNISDNGHVGNIGGRRSNPLKISLVKEIMDVQGEHPVIYVSLKSVRGSLYEEIESKLKSLLVDLFDRYRYVKPALKPDDRRTFHRFHGRQSPTTELPDALKFLSRVLYERYRMEVYVFVDDYDAPIVHLLVVLWRGFRRRNKHKSDEQLLAEVYRSHEFRRVVWLIENLIGRALNRNEYLEQGVISGIVDISLATSVTNSSGLRNDIRYSVLETVFSDYHGFDEREVNALLSDRASCSLSSLERKAVREWYAYNFDGYVVYNPYSIARFVSNGCVLRNYWNPEGGTPLTEDVVLTADSMQSRVHTLMDGGVIRYANYSTELNFERPITDNPNVLLFNGYLNVMRPDYFTEQFAVANLEVRNIMKDKILRWIQRKLRIPAMNFIALFRRLSAFRMDEFRQKLRKHLSLIPMTKTTRFDNPTNASLNNSNTNTTTTTNNNNNNNNVSVATGNGGQPADDTAVYVNATMKCLIRSFEKFFIIEEGLHSSRKGCQRSDNTVLLISKPDAITSNGIIMKYSFAPTADDLAETADKGLSEIGETSLNIIKYRLPNYINQTLELSMAFYQKDVALKYKITKL